MAVAQCRPLPVTVIFGARRMSCRCARTKASLSATTFGNADSSFVTSVSRPAAWRMARIHSRIAAVYPWVSGGTSSRSQTRGIQTSHSRTSALSSSREKARTGHPCSFAYRMAFRVERLLPDWEMPTASVRDGCRMRLPMNCAGSTALACMGRWRSARTAAAVLT